MPCRIRLLKSAKPVVEFYEPHDDERLIAAAASTDSRTSQAWGWETDGVAEKKPKGDA